MNKNILISIIIISIAIVSSLFIVLGSTDVSLVETVSAKEIYPLFACPCNCGETIDAECCSSAIERKTYVDGLVAGGMERDEVILTYVKKYGLDSFFEEENKEVYKEKLLEDAPEERAEIAISPSVIDLGDVSEEKGIVSESFKIKNEGSRDLVIESLETSCNCTSASIVYKGKEGPRFNMPGHGINESIDKSWKVVLPPGEEAELKVYYDPSVHEGFRGYAIRQISVFSNDPLFPTKKVTVELNQVK